MRRVLAIARLTFAEGVRMRIVLVFLVVLVILVLRMPFTLRGDETLTGRVQNFLSYSLGALGALLSLATVFFSCATLTNEIRERSLHLVVTKPVSRFQILLGKWLGVNLLNLLMVILCGAAIYGLASFLRHQPPLNERDRLLLEDGVWAARLAASPVMPEKEIAQAAQQEVERRVRSGEIEESQKAQKLAEQVKAYQTRWRQVESGGQQFYEFRNLAPPRSEDTVIQVRYKAIGIPIPPNEMLTIGWVFCDPDSGAPLHPPVLATEQAGNVHQFLVRAAPVVRDGRALLCVINPFDPQRRTTVYFEGDQSLQVLYRVGSFQGNFLKALSIIVLQLLLLSAVGLFFGVFVSFPVACLCSSVFYLICLGLPFIMEAIGANDTQLTPDVDPYGRWGPAVRAFLVPFLRSAFPDFSQYSGVGYLIDGENISLALLGRSMLRTLLYGGILLLLPGWLIFQRREIAEVTV